MSGEPGVGSEFLVNCMVVAGDSPLDLVWHKNGQPILPGRTDSSPHDLWHTPGDRRERRHPVEDTCHPPSRSGDYTSIDDGTGSYDGYSENIVDPRVIVNQLGDRFSLLRFISLCPHHSGNITCVAANSAGTATSSYSLFVWGNCGGSVDDVCKAVWWSGCVTFMVTGIPTDICLLCHLLSARPDDVLRCEVQQSAVLSKLA